MKLNFQKVCLLAGITLVGFPMIDGGVAYGMSSSQEIGNLATPSPLKKAATSWTTAYQLPFLQDAERYFSEHSIDSKSATFSDEDDLNTTKYKVVVAVHSLFPKRAAEALAKAERQPKIRHKQTRYESFLTNTDGKVEGHVTVEIRPYGSNTNPFLNDACATLMDNFLSLTENSEEGTSLRIQRLQQLYSNFNSMVIAQEEQVSTLTKALAGQEDEAMCASLTALKQTAENQSLNLRIRFREMICHSAAAIEYIMAAREAINQCRTYVAQNPMQSALDSRTKAEIKATITKWNEDVVFLQESISNIESLLHALYPYERSGFAATAVSAARWLTLSAVSTQAGRTRCAITGSDAMPRFTDIVLNAPVMPNAPSASQYYARYYQTMKYLLCASDTLNDAFAAKFVKVRTHQITMDQAHDSLKTDIETDEVETKS